MTARVIEYEVIADYPASMFEVGDKFTVYEGIGVVYFAEIGDNSIKGDVRDFPHLFRKVDAITK